MLVNLYPTLKTTPDRFSAFADIRRNEVRTQIIHLVFTNYKINEVPFRKNNERRMRLLFQITHSKEKNMAQKEIQIRM